MLTEIFVIPADRSINPICYKLIQNDWKRIVQYKDTKEIASQYRYKKNDNDYVTMSGNDDNLDVNVTIKVNTDEVMNDLLDNFFSEFHVKKPKKGK